MSSELSSSALRPMIESVNALHNDLLELDARQALTLYQVGKLVTASLDLEATLDAVTEATHQLTGAHSTALALLDWDGSLVIRAGRGEVEASIGESLATDHGITGRAITEQQPVLVPDMLEETGRARPELDQKYGVRTFLAVPLTWHGEPLGVVTVAFPAPDALDPKDVALVGALAEQAAAAVAHARDYAEEQRLRAESEEITRQLAEQAAQLDRVQRQLVQNEKLTAMGQLVQGLAHEINTPLSVVITNLSVLGRHVENLSGVAQAAQAVLPLLQADALQAAIDDADLEYTLEDLPDLLSESSTAARRVADLVRSMGTFARRDTGGPTALDIHEVLESALNLASNKLKERARTVREFGAPPAVLGLASELTELFLHLLINAAQALGEPGTVTISTAYEAGQVVVRIRDTGRGIPAEHLPRVFDPFFTTRQVGEGTGMGLAVCYGIVGRHGGSIALASEPGLGTTVTVSLPSVLSNKEAA
ncbi:MAG TPA: ATP-binding protein [Chloroflexota bacterium]|jgi:signal transduction histidine kinase